MFTYVGRGNALPHSSDRNDGGDDGVPRPGRRLGRRSFITFGYRPKASGKDTGWAWGRRPDLRAIAHAADPFSCQLETGGGYLRDSFNTLREIKVLRFRGEDGRKLET